MKNSLIKLYFGIILAEALCTLGCGPAKVPPSKAPEAQIIGSDKTPMKLDSGKNSGTFTLKYSVKDGKLETSVKPGETTEKNNEKKPDPAKKPPLITTQMASNRPSGGSVDESFLKLSDDEKISLLIPIIIQNQAPDTMAEFMRKAGKEKEFHALLVKMLAMSDSRMATETFDLQTTYLADGSMEEKKANQRTDDGIFKEFLLYVIRDSLPPDSPHLQAIFDAFWKEKNPWTRMRIVRATGKIGGEKVLAFLREVLKKEENQRTLAAQEAARRLE